MIPPSHHLMVTKANHVIRTAMHAFQPQRRREEKKMKREVGEDLLASITKSIYP